MIDPAMGMLEIKDIPAKVRVDKRGTSNEFFNKTFTKISIIVYLSGCANAPNPGIIDDNYCKIELHFIECNPTLIRIFKQILFWNFCIVYCVTCSMWQV